MNNARICQRQLVFLLFVVSIQTVQAEGERVRLLKEVARLSANDIPVGLFGGAATSVAISGDWIVVGVPSDNQFAEGSGAAYVFRRSGASWVEHYKLKGLPIIGDDMGYSVAIDGDWIVTGAPNFPSKPGGNAGFGRAYVYRRDDWGTPDDLSDDLWDLVGGAVLNPPPSQWCCGFGYSVDIEGPVIVVGTLPGSTNPHIS